MPGTYTRRVFLSGVPALGILGAPGAGQAVPSEAKKYPDPATEFEVVRLTDPAHTSRLPAFYNRAISHRSNFLLYTSDRAGAPQAYRMDLKTFESKQLTDAKALLPGSLVLGTDERAFHFADGTTVYSGNPSNPRTKSVYDAPVGFEVQSLSASDDTTHLFVVESSSNAWRLRALRLLGNGPTGAIESPEPISDPMPRPKRAGILYRRGGELWLTNYDGAQNHRLRVAAGGIGPALWSSDGRTIFYINFPEGGKALNNIREFDPDTNEDRPVANTSQYVHFGRNSDSSVFVGASGSKASPYILLLVRAVKRELALCEHRASDPSQVAPIFAPNSQRVFFQSDRHGKMAIYSIRVERLVEATEN